MGEIGRANDGILLQVSSPNFVFVFDVLNVYVTVFKSDEIEFYKIKSKKVFLPSLYFALRQIFFVHLNSLFEVALKSQYFKIINCLNLNDSKFRDLKNITIIKNLDLHLTCDFYTILILINT
ncbi:hypothetical protein BpHYR1_032249 [Brachionus plicatilis]|uniref:Uncharacterized protein n=1 Tax=Brachionus plicatilis TaxID=10195 RepID=A0A3M7PAU9_BRAPC|nr:hypothetical protein BpHYR1_032249 [Brachionus plicatilis]